VDAVKHCNVPVIWQIHEDTSKIPQKQIQKIHTQANQVITVSKTMFEAFKKFKNKSSYIYNGISLKPSKEQTQPTPLFVALGTIEPRKGFHTLIEAASLLKAQGHPFKIHIYGKPLPTTRKYFEKLQKKIKQDHLEAFVEFKGVTTNIAKAMAPAWAVVVPSLSEPFGRVAVEAMALKNPVIASQVGGLSEIVVNHKTGLLFPAENSTALAKKMTRIIQDKKLVKKLGSAGYRRYQKNFTLKKHVLEIEKIYSKIMSFPRRREPQP
jgi:glycosyltransferase involved in cell wall biosynthesis